jgi:NADP-reducing hydrogenase subunit HndC
MVDMVKYFLTFLAHESCGKCTPCRDGIRQMLHILQNITAGKGKKGDLELLELISTVQKKQHCVPWDKVPLTHCSAR